MKLPLAGQQGKWHLAVNQEAVVVLSALGKDKVGLVPTIAEPDFGPNQKPCHVSGEGGLLPMAFLPSPDLIILAYLPN